MGKQIILNLNATTVEQSIDRVCYGIKLLKNDGEFDILIGLDKSTEGDITEDVIQLKVGEAFEDWNVSPFGTIYYKSLGGNSSFRLYSESIV